MQDRKRFGEALSRHLAGLTGAQKVAAGTLVVVIIATALWFGGRAPRGASAGRMVPILDQSFADAEINSITQHLRSRSIPCDVRDGKVYVPADKKLDVLSDL